MDLTTHSDGTTTITISKREQLFEDPLRVADLVRQIVAERVADQYLAEHGASILARVDPQAIANLAIADAAGAIRTTLEKKMPDVIHHHTEIRTRRGWF